MKKNRIVFAVLSLMMTVSMMTGCGNSEHRVAKTSLDTSGKEITETSSVTPAPSGDEKQESTAPDEHAPEPDKSVTEAVSIEETVIFDQDGIRVTAKSLDNSSIFGPSLVMLMENDSGKDLTFQARNVSVNGYMISTMFSCDVANGKKANDTLTIMKNELEKAQITTIADIEFSLHIFETDSWENKIDSDPIKLVTSTAAGYTYTYDDSGNPVYEGNGVKIVVKGLSEDQSVFGPGIILYLENSGNQGVTVQARDVSINGFMISPMFSCDLPAGKHAVDAITFMKSDLEKNSIDRITDVELSFHIFKMEGWDTVADTETVTIQF